MGSSAPFGDPFGRAVYLIRLHRVDLADSAQEAERKGDKAWADECRTQIADLDHRYAILKSRMTSDLAATRELFLAVFNHARELGLPEDRAARKSLEAFEKSQSIIADLLDHPEVIDLTISGGLFPEPSTTSIGSETTDDPPIESVDEFHGELRQAKEGSAEGVEPPMLDEDGQGSLRKDVTHDDTLIDPPPEAGTSAAAPASSDGVAAPLSGQPSTDETVNAQRKRLAADDLRYKLGVANHALREAHRRDGKRHVTVKELARQIGRNPSYVGTRARKLGIELGPYKLLYGPPIFDPLLVIEKI